MHKLPNVDKQIFDLIVEAVKVAGEQMGWVTREDIKHLPSKEEYYAGQDKLMKELVEKRESNIVLNNRTSRHSDRIEKLEKIHPNDSHAGLQY